MKNPITELRKEFVEIFMNNGYTKEKAIKEAMKLCPNLTPEEIKKIYDKRI